MVTGVVIITEIMMQFGDLNTIIAYSLNPMKEVTFPSIDER